jgi:hypothetical protein
MIRHTLSDIADDVAFFCSRNALVIAALSFFAIYVLSQAG